MLLLSYDLRNPGSQATNPIWVITVYLHLIVREALSLDLERQKLKLRSELERLKVLVVQLSKPFDLPGTHIGFVQLPKTTLGQSSVQNTQANV